MGLASPTTRSFASVLSVKPQIRSGIPAFGLPGVDLGTLCAYPWILPGSDTRPRTELETAFANRRLAVPENRVERTAIRAVSEMLANTDSVTVLPFLMAHDAPAPTAELLLGHIRTVASELQHVVDLGTAEDASSPNSQRKLP